MINKIFILISLGLLLLIPMAQADDQEIKLLLAKPFVKAEFTKLRQLKILSRPFTTSGKILFLPEKGLVWQTLKPIEDTLLISHAGVSQIKKNNPDPIKINNPVVKSASAVFITVLSLDLERIKTIFTVKEGNKIGQNKSYTLKPKDATLSKVIDYIELSGKERVEKIHIQEHSGDSTLVTIDNEVFESSKLSTAEQRLFELM